MGEPTVVDVAHEAPRAVAALLDLRPVCIEYAVVKVDTGLSRWLDLQDLIAPDSEVAVRDNRTWSCVRAMGLTKASKTTKSLPSPCILVNFSLI